MPTVLAIAALSLTGEQWNGPAGTPRCEDQADNLVTSWKNNFNVGERAFLLQSQSSICQGVDCDQEGGFEAKYAWRCAAKGQGGVGSADVLSPYVGYIINGPGPEFHSYKPCQFFSDIQAGLPNGMVINETIKSESDGEACPVPKADTCEYPDVPADHTRPTFTYWGSEGNLEHGPSHWGGLLLSVDYQHADYQHPNPHLQATYWNHQETISHGPIHGIEGSACDYSDDFSRVGEAFERAYYDGGVLIDQRRGPFTMRSFMFKNDADRAIAMQDERNKGLQYAKSFAGENGCDTEVVWEIEQFPEGGFELSITTPLDAPTCESEERLRNAIAAYYTGEEIVVMVEYTALRASHFLDEDCGPSGYKELLRFASSFVCVETGVQHTADIVMLNDENEPFAPEPANRTGGPEYDGQVIRVMSRDPANPTRYYTGKGVQYMSETEGVCTGAIDYRPHGNRFHVALSAADAAGCSGNFYWDPLLQAVAGDGVGLVIPEGATFGGEESPVGMPVGAIVGGAVGIGALIVVGLSFMLKRGPFSSKKKSAQAV